MEEKWYEGLSDDALLTEENKKYNEAIKKIIDAVKKGTGFDEACNSLNIADAELKKTIFDDALKIIIAEMNFGQKMSTDKIAGLLKISVERVNSAREIMLEEIDPGRRPSLF